MEIKITESEADQRLDRFLRKFFKTNHSIRLSDIYSWIRKWAVKVNERKKSQDYKLQLWDKIVIHKEMTEKWDIDDSFMTKEQKQKNIQLQDLKKYILFEDDNWIFWNKKAWLVVHPWNKHIDDLTLNDLLLEYLKATNSLKKTSTFTPSFGFRLDKDTSWIIVWAKNYEALKYLNEIIRLRETHKQYITVVKWKFPSNKIIDEPIFRWFNTKYWRAQSFVNYEQGVESKTQWFLIKSVVDPHLGPISLVKVKLFTWRMHQIRVHFSYIWFPIIWDMLYWDQQLNRIAESKYKITRQLLHSHIYWFFDKFIKKDILIESDIPKDISHLFKSK